MTAECLCGGVRIEISGKVGPVVYCHCSRCRKASGTAFGANVVLSNDDVFEAYDVEVVWAT